MYISIRDGVVMEGKYATLAEGLRALGVEAVELGFNRDRTATALDSPQRMPLDSPDAAKRYRDHLAQYGVRPAAFLLATDFNQPDLDAEVAWVVGAVRAADILGMAAIRVDSAMTGQRELPMDERVDRYARGIKRVLAETEGANVALGVENHGYQGNDPKWLDSLFEKVGSPRFGMTLDTGNFYWAGHPLDRVYQILEHFAPLTKHTHAKNIAYPPQLRNVQREMGWEYGKYVAPLYEGDIDHRRVAQILKKVGYDGDLCIEDESMGHYTEAERREVLRKDVAHFREALK
jgi:sugar phosphate isomerase/epimerase